MTQKQLTQNLWLDLMDANGDIEKIFDRINRESDPVVITAALVYFAAFTWPAVMKQMDQESVSVQAMVAALEGAVITGASEYLRKDVK
ncbi:hypothetical protein ACFXG4_51645 [Nocardia sp. NPDC059246]|uniref:hypothetical protein n=1 Tax=unclassified Nocardia TaxID=2637762 RepID=UPI00367CB977